MWVGITWGNEEEAGSHTAVIKKIGTVLKNIWSDPVWSKVISIGVVGLLTAFWAYFSGYWGKITAAFIWLSDFFNQEVINPLWVMVIAVPVLLLAIPTIIRLLPERKPRFTQYVNDNIFGIAWHWSWGKIDYYSDKLHVIGLHARCPECKSILEVNNFRPQLLLCINDACSWKWKRPSLSGKSISDYSELGKKVMTEIDRKVTTGEF
jgi:hypothetical protein